MAGSTQSSCGLLTAVWRYPVKSMMGEELNAAEAAADGLLGDRAYALVDSSDGKVATAKNPRKWPTLFDFRAALADSPSTGMATPPVRITLPDGIIISWNKGARRLKGYHHQQRATRGPRDPLNGAQAPGHT